MTHTQIIRILNFHGVPHFEENGRIYADSMIAFTKKFEIVEDITNWTRRELLTWLGY